MDWAQKPFPFPDLFRPKTHKFLGAPDENIKTYIHHSFTLLNLSSDAVPSMLNFGCLRYSDWCAKVIIDGHLERASTPVRFPLNIFTAINIPLAHTIIPTLSCHFSVNYGSIHTLRPQKSNHKTFFCSCILLMEQPCSANHNITTTQNVMKTNNMRMRENSYCHHFYCQRITFEII